MHSRLSVLMLAALMAAALAVRAQVTGEAATKVNAPKTAGVTTSSQDPLAVGPNIYRLVLENERVRVMEARFKPGAEVGHHAHPDHVVVVTSAGKLAISTAQGTQVLDTKVGDAFFFPAESHSAQNVGPTEFVCVVTELKGKTKAKDQASPKPGTTEVQQGKVDG